MTQRLPSEQRRQQLADAALKILSREGARAVTVKNIAKMVGITDGAVFRHFPDTAALFDAAIARFDERLPELPDEALAPKERLAAFFVGRTAAVRAQPEILGLAGSDRLEQLASRDGAKRLRRRMQESVAFVTGALQEAQADGQIDDSVDVRTLTWMLTGAMRGAARSGADPDECWRDVASVLFRKRRRKREKK
jgi:AcrR family transcriptional regulator